MSESTPVSSKKSDNHEVSDIEDNITFMKTQLKILQESPDSIFVKDKKDQPGSLASYFLHLAGKDSSLYTSREAWKHRKLAPAGRSIAIASFLFADGIAYVSGFLPAAARTISDGDLNKAILLKTAAVIGAVYFISSEMIDSGMFQRLRKAREEAAAHLKGLREGGAQRLEQVADPSERIKVRIENESLYVQETARVYAIYGSAAIFTLAAAMLARQGDINTVLDQNEIAQIDDIRADIQERFTGLETSSDEIQAKIRALDSEINGDTSAVTTPQITALNDRIDTLQAQYDQLETQRIEKQGLADREAQGLGTYVDPQTGEVTDRVPGKAARYNEHMQEVKDITAQMDAVSEKIEAAKTERDGLKQQIQSNIAQTRADREENLAGTKENLEAQLTKVTNQIKNFGDIEGLVKQDARYPDVGSPISPAEQIDAFLQVAWPDTVGKGILLGSTALIGLLSYNTEMGFLKMAVDDHVEDIELREIRHEIASQRKQAEMTAVHQKITELEAQKALVQGELEVARLEQSGGLHALELLKEQRRKNAEIVEKISKIQSDQNNVFEKMFVDMNVLAHKIRTDGFNGAVTDPERKKLLAGLLEQSAVEAVETALQNKSSSREGVNYNKQEENVLAKSPMQRPA